MYIVDFLQSRGIGFETLLHRPAFSATRRARNMRVTGEGGEDGAGEVRRRVRAGGLAGHVADRPGKVGKCAPG